MIVPTQHRRTQAMIRANIQTMPVMVSPQAILSYAVGISILFFVVASIMPSALSTFFAVNTDAWDSTVVTLWDNIPIFAMLGVAIAVISGALVYLKIRGS